MRQEGAIIPGIGGDNSHASAGSFFEGVMTAGFPTDSADNAVQSNIVEVGYGAPTGLSGTLTPGSEVSLQATTACCIGDYIRNQNGAAVIAPITSHSAERDKGDSTWIVRHSLADNSCVSFEPRNDPGDFLRLQNSALHVQPFDGTALNRSDATFCPQPRKDGKGYSFHAVNYPTKYIRHYNGKVYIASDGGGTNPWDTKRFGVTTQASLSARLGRHRTTVTLLAATIVTRGAETRRGSARGLLPASRV
jgi:non-reducing end alpha-L-arabinofuranosidase